MKSRIAAIAWSLLIAMTSCSNDDDDGPSGEVCSPDSTQACDCPDGSVGERVCSSDGQDWEACDCEVADDDDDPPPLDDYVEGPFVRFVDPFIGTGGVGFGVGSNYPGPAMPFGMIHAGPDTAMNGQSPSFSHCVGYWYPDNEIIGFSHTRMSGIGIADQGNILVMPVPSLNHADLLDENYRSTFDKATETASVGYYAVTLDNGDIRVELTTGYRAAMHRIQYASSANRHLLFDATHFAAYSDNGLGEAVARLDDDGRIRGSVLHTKGMSGRGGGMMVYFVAELNTEIVRSQVWTQEGLAEGTSSVGLTNTGLALTLADGDEPVMMKIAVSFISEANAELNLLEESPNGDWDFEAMRARAEAEWEPVLEQIRVGGGTEEEYRIFYTALYHVYAMPTLFTEADGRYQGLDKAPHTPDGFTYYTDFSLWDTYHTFHPLMLLLDEEVSVDFAKSLLAMAEDGQGGLPRWPAGTTYTGTMIGDSADLVLTETYLKGVTGWDVEKAYELMIRQATQPRPAGNPGPWRGGVEEYMSLGYVPERSSTTLEYAYCDWAIANLAEALGEEEDAAIFREREKYYANLWDPEVDFIRAKDAEGNWLEPFDPLAWDPPYVEGNSWQWSWYVAHDIPGLIDLFGGSDAFLEKLTDFFEMSDVSKDELAYPRNAAPDLYYWPGNEPDIHAAYLFNDAGRPDLTRKWVRRIMDVTFTDGPEGLPGNDDGGTMSAWIVFSALGFYPLAGGVEYWLGEPLFNHALIARPNGDIEIRAPGANEGAEFEDAVLIGGQPATGRFSHPAIRDGALIEFQWKPPSE